MQKGKETNLVIYKMWRVGIARYATIGPPQSVRAFFKRWLEILIQMHSRTAHVALEKKQQQQYLSESISVFGLPFN